MKKKQRIQSVIAVGKLPIGPDGVLIMPDTVAPGDNPIGSLIRSSVKCVKCGTAFGGCDCWTKCACGWSYERGGKCDNEDAHRCKRERAGMRCAFDIGHEEPHTYVEEDNG